MLRKKPLIFLHWYHHVTVLLYCWHSYYEQTTYGLYFIAMNYTVHGTSRKERISIRNVGGRGREAVSRRGGGGSWASQR